MSDSWNINDLLSTYWGMYLVQIILHSVVVAVLAECAIMAWQIRSPASRQWLRVMVLVLPLAAFPVFQLLSPDRGTIFFRLQSLFDSNRLLLLDLPGTIPMLVPLFIVLGLSSVIFLVQELIPVITNMLAHMRGESVPLVEKLDERSSEKIERALSGLSVGRDSVEVLDDDDLVLYSSTGANPIIYVSAGMLQQYDIEHLQGAFAHEIAHIRRSRRPLLMFAYILRTVMFFNPVALVEFRRLAQEEEKACDDYAVSMTGKPQALAEAISMLRPAQTQQPPESDGKSENTIEIALEDYGHDILLQSRERRLRELSGDIALWGIPHIATFAAFAVIAYYVV
ncbi:MAG: peptidase M56 BlaR1 [Nitrospirae bacterium]|nr:MAG: peptidase M56 BlaR1 [Nitrospirota bacterium]